MKNFKLCFLAFCLLFCSRTYAQSKIDTTETLMIGGIKQDITLKGDDRLKPLFLFITGGPGLPGIYPENETFTNELQKHFVIVQWDQRQCGETLKLNPSPVKLTVKLYEQDTYELVQQLLSAFHREKLFLMGWSWGTVLGFYMADKHPELLYTYMAVSPVTNQWRSEELALKMLKEKAVKDNNQLAIKELADIQVPFKNNMQVYYDRKWLAASSGTDIGDEKEFKKYFTENLWALDLFQEAMNNNLMVTLPKINCPVYFFVGHKDYQTNFSVSQAYYNELKAPKKQLFWFEKSAHLVPFTEPVLMQQIIIDQILPQAYK